MNFLFKIYYFDVFYHEDFRYVLEKNLKFWLKKAQNIGFSGQNTLLEVHLSVQV